MDIFTDIDIVGGFECEGDEFENGAGEELENGSIELHNEPI